MFQRKESLERPSKIIRAFRREKRRATLKARMKPITEKLGRP